MSNLKVALYARVSTTDKGQDPEVQLRALRAEAGRRGWQVAREHVDHGVSGATPNRPALDALMESARAGNYDIVLVWAYDRFARSTKQLIDSLDTFRQLDVQFVSLQEQFDTTSPAGELMYTVIAGMAQFERRMIQARVRAGVARAKAAGKHCGRPRKDVDVSEARRLLDGGLSQRQVAKKLNLSRALLQRRLAEGRAGGSKGSSLGGQP